MYLARGFRGQPLSQVRATLQPSQRYFQTQRRRAELSLMPKGETFICQRARMGMRTIVFSMTLLQSGHGRRKRRCALNFAFCAKGVFG